MELNPSVKEPGGQADEIILVRNYSSYRQFLFDWYEQKKRQRSGFSYRRFSALLGLKSPNFVQLVISGQRNLSQDLATRLCKILRLQGADRAFFLALVQFEDAKSPDEKVRAEKMLLAARKRQLTTHIDQLRAQILSEWYHMLVRELVFLPDFKPNGDYISARLNGLITVEQGEQSLRMLIEAGFIVLSQDGCYKAIDVAIDTGDYIFDRHLMEKHHAQTLLAWGRNLNALSPESQELGLLHIPIASEKIPELRNRIRKFQDEIIGWLVEEKNPDRVVQLGTYLIPFSSN